MRFANPLFLALAALVPACGLLWSFLKARREKALSRLVAPSLRGRLMPKGADLWGLQAFFVLFGLFLCLFAASRPQWGRSLERYVERSRNVVIAVDVSRSMLAADVRPSRLERTKADVADLIDSLDGDRCAIVAFRRTGVAVCPLTTDHGFLRGALEQLSPESAPAGETDLGGAIRASLDALDPAADDHNAIILISDGGDLKGEALENASLAKKRGVPVFTVGIGDPRVGAPIPSADGRGMQKFQGSEVRVKLEETALKAIAETSGGRYVPLATAGTAETTLGAIYRRFLRQVAAKEQNEEESRAAERYQFFLVPGLILLLAGVALSKGRFNRRTIRAVRTAVVALSVVYGLGCSAPRSAAEWSGRYMRTRAEADRAAWIDALDREGHDFSKRYTPDYGPRGIYKFNVSARLACFVITKEIAERLRSDSFVAETPDGQVRFEWKSRADGMIEYAYSSPTNWDVFVKVWRAAEPERNPKPEANIHFWTPFPQRGAVAFEIAHHRSDWAAGPYAGVPFPTNEIRAVNNFAFALREALPLLGFDRAESFDGVLWVGTFDSNFPNGHHDFPPHFHLTASCRDGLQVHHYYPRAVDGRLTLDCFQDMSNVVDVWDRAMEFRPGDEFPYYDGHGRVALRVKMLADGEGLELSTAFGDRRVRVAADSPAELVVVSVWKKGIWENVLSVAVKDDPVAGVMQTPEGEIRYDPASGRRLDGGADEVEVR